MAEETHDPLELLRAAISSDLHSTLLTAAQEPADSLPLASYISFPQPSGPAINLTKDTSTRYTAKAGSTTELYTIAQIWVAWTERNSSIKDYLTIGRQPGAGFVSISDRKGVVDYLQGGEDTQGRVLAKDHEEGNKETAASATVEALPSALEHEAGPSKPAAAVKRKYEVDLQDREFCKKLRAEEVELRDRNSVMRSSGSGKVNNFESFVKGVMVEKIRALRKSLEQSGGRAPQAASQQTADPMRGAKKAKQTNPIIMISSSPTALITMWNVKKFLEQGIFEPSDQARQREADAGNFRAEDMVPVVRKRTGPNGDVVQKYYVIDGVEALQKFGQDAWDRVLCVLTTGQAWQFRPYKWQDPKTLFRNVTGIYFQWNNEPSNPAVKEWNVKEMRIDKTKRHTDQHVVADFWRMLDSARRR